MTNGLPSTEIHRALPRDVDSERALLACVIQRHTLIDDMQVRREWFTPEHQLIFDQILTLGELANLVSLVVELKDRNQLEHVGGASYLAEITGQMVSIHSAAYFVNHVRDAFIRREVIQISMESCARAYEMTPEGAPAVVSGLEMDLTKLVSEMDNTAKSERSFKEIVMDTIEGIEERFSARGKIQGVPTGLSRLDRMTGGFRRQNMIVIAARPSVGKTAAALQVADSCIEQKIPTGFISLEMSGNELCERLLSRRSHINGTMIRDGEIRELDFPRLTSAMGRLSEQPLFIDDRASLTISQVASKARQWKRKHGIRILVIDYLQLMRSESARSKDSREVEVSQISRGCKALAKELDIPVVVLAQLNRDNQKGGSIRRPRLSDLRESGAIEQDADAVIFLHPQDEEKDEDDEKKADGKPVEPPSIVNVTAIVAKQRNGPTGDIKLRFDKAIQTFYEISNDHE